MAHIKCHHHALYIGIIAVASNQMVAQSYTVGSSIDEAWFHLSNLQVCETYHFIEVGGLTTKPIIDIIPPSSPLKTSLNKLLTMVLGKRSLLGQSGKTRKSRVFGLCGYLAYPRTNSCQH